MEYHIPIHNYSYTPEMICMDVKLSPCMCGHRKAYHDHLDIDCIQSMIWSNTIYHNGEFAPAMHAPRT